MSLSRRDWVYVALLVFVAIGSTLDSVYQPYPHSYSLNDFVQMVGIIILCAWWQIEDANVREMKRGTAARIFTVLFMPVGLAIHLFQSRKAGRATIILISFILGVIGAAITGTLAGEQFQLVRQGM
jgi:putative effector of murein hydrolase LrgA (UPF0299 family)